MNKTVASVIDDINEWENPRGGSVFYVTAIFTDESVGSVGRKDHDAALEVQGLLREAIGEELDFTLEPAGQTKTGREKFKIKGFGTVGGAATYTAPGVQTSGGFVPIKDANHANLINTEASIRASVALKAAVNYCAPQHKALALDDVFLVAENFDAWLARKASEPASSAYPEGGDASAPSGSPVVQAGAGSEQSAAETADGGTGVGEGPCPPHDLDLDVAPRAMRYPCRRCGFWVKPTMAAEEAEEART